MPPRPSVRRTAGPRLVPHAAVPSAEASIQAARARERQARAAQARISGQSPHDFDTAEGRQRAREPVGQMDQVLSYQLEILQRLGAVESMASSMKRDVESILASNAPTAPTEAAEPVVDAPTEAAEPPVEATAGAAGD